MAGLNEKNRRISRRKIRQRRMVRWLRDQGPKKKKLANIAANKAGE